MANKITEFLFKDVTNANESNRVSFIVRINSLMMSRSHDIRVVTPTFIWADF